MNQTQIIKLNCQNCGSSLDISQDMENFACGYCGTSQMVERKGGIIQLKKVADAISKVQRGTDKTAAELALARLPKEINNLNHQKKMRQNQLTKEYSEKRQLQSIAIVFIAGIALVTTLLIVRTTLSIIITPDNATNISIFLSIGIACVFGFSLDRYFYKSDSFRLKTISIEKNTELSKYDEKIRELEEKIQKNYKIANS